MNQIVTENNCKHLTERRENLQKLNLAMEEEDGDGETEDGDDEFWVRKREWWGCEIKGFS